MREWKLFLTIALPLGLLPLPLYLHEPQWWCAYVLVLMAIFWVTECIPVGVTGLLPSLILPLTGVLTLSECSSNYWKDINFMILGALAVGVLVEKSGLHLRIALRIMSLLGDKIGLHLAGFMFVTWLLSMWMSNTAATALMLPTVEALLEQYKRPSKVSGKAEESGKDSEKHHSAVNVGFTSSEPEEVVAKAEEKAEAEEKRKKAEAAEKFLESQRAKMLFIGLAYAATIGGVAMLTGTPTNLILLEALRKYFDTDFGLNFLRWATFAVPVSSIMLILCWLWLLYHFLGIKVITELFVRKRGAQGSDSPSEAQQMLREKYLSLGPMRSTEIVAAVYLVVLVVLWMTREPGFAPGWGALFVDGFVPDASPAVVIAFLAILTPAALAATGGHQDAANALTEASESSPKQRGNGAERVSDLFIDWREVAKDIPWSLFFMIGGAFAISDGASKTGLTKTLGQSLNVLSSLPSPLIMVIITLTAAVSTEFASNVAIISILVPIVLEMSIIMNFHPLFVSLPVTVATSFAFSLPMGTPPNLLVYSKGYFSQMEMVRSGVAVDVIGQLTLDGLMFTLGSVLFDLTPLGPLSSIAAAAAPNATATAASIADVVAAVSSATASAVANTAS